MSLAQALLMNAQCSGGSRSFAKEMRALKTRSAVAGHQKLQGPTERIVDADLTTTKEVAEELSVDHAMVVQHLEQGGKVKNFHQKYKKSLFWGVDLFHVRTTNHFSIRLWCSMKSGFYRITGNDQLSGWAEKKLQSTS